MNFLTPLFLFGGLAVGLPILFHLVRRSTKEQIPFSSLMFLRPSPPRVTRRSRLDNLLLLLLRCLVLCLLAVGFARPFLKRPMVAAPDAAGNVREIVLVDSSASMRREDLWNEAVTRAEARLRKLSPGDQAAVIVFDQRTRSLVSFAEWSGADSGGRVAGAVQRLRELKPGWGSTSFGTALVTAAELFEESDRKEHQTGPRRIVLISDLQEGGRLEGLQGFEWARGVEVVVEEVRVRKPTNAGIQWMNTADESMDAGGDGGMRVRVSNSSDANREQFQVRSSGGAVIGEIYVPPGQSRTLPVPDAAVAGGNRIVVGGDDAEFDNSFHLIPPRIDRIKVLFFGGDKESDPSQALYYLKRVFLANARRQVEIVAQNGEGVLNAAGSAGAEFVIVSDAISQESAGLVQQLLRAGKTVLLSMKTPGAAATIGRIAGIGGVESSEAPVSNYAMLGQIDFQHPLFASFADPRFSDFTKIHFWKHRRIRADQFPGARVLARFDGKEADPAMLQVRVGAGQLFVFTFGWFPSDSQFALSSKFVPLLYSFLEFSGAIKAQTSQYTIGDPVDLSAVKGTGDLTVRKPDGVEVKLAGGGRFDQTDIPGIYEVASVQPPFRFAVNVASEESRTAPLPVETLERLGVPMKTQPLQTAKHAGHLEQTRQHLAATELEGRQKLWRWLIVAALVVLMVETWFAGRLTRPGAPQREASA